MNDWSTRYRRGHIPDRDSAQGLAGWVAEMGVTVDDEVDGIAIDDPAKLAVTEHPIFQGRLVAERRRGWRVVHDHDR